MTADNFKVRLQRLSPAQRALLEKRLCKADHQNPITATIPLTESSESVRNSAYAFPVSFAQQRLWFLQQLEPKSATYNMTTTFRLHGKLDVTALQQSVDNIIQRHEVLRTTFAMRNSEARQIVHPASLTSLLITDLRDNDISQREEILGRLLQDHARQPFDLERGPLFRVGLTQINNDDYVMHACMHHIISDGWSMGVLLKELTALYNAHYPNCRFSMPTTRSGSAIGCKARTSISSFPTGENNSMVYRPCNSLLIGPARRCKPTADLASR